VALAARIAGSTGIGDIEFCLIQRKGKAIRAGKVVGHPITMSGFWTDPIDVLTIKFRLRLKPLIVGLDAIGRIGEPDRIVGFDDHIVRTVETLALETIGENARRPIVLPTNDPPVAMLATDHAALAIDRGAVGIRAGAALKGADHTGRFIPAQAAIVGDIAPDQGFEGGCVNRALGPAAAGPELLDRFVAFYRSFETVVEDFVAFDCHCRAFCRGGAEHLSNLSALRCYYFRSV